MTKPFSDMREKKTPCWSGYKMVGMKKKNGRMVPNCVKEELVDLVLGKEYVSEGVEDMYKGKLNQAQINTIKNTWQHKKTLLPQDKQRVKDFLGQMDQFTKMQLKQANIKHVSAMIEENELDFSEPLCDLLEDIEFRAAVRGQELKEFSDDELNKLAIAYKDLAGKTMSVQNANKLRKLFDRIPDSSLDKLRKKKIPFLSGLALSRMIQKKMPVRESAYKQFSDFEGVEELQEARWEIEGIVSYRGIGSEDSFHMVIDAPNESAAERKVEKELDKARDRRKIGPGGGGSVEDFDIENIERTTDKLSPPETFRGLNSFDPALKEVRVYRVSHPSKKTYEVEGDNEKEAIRRYKDEVGLKSDSGIRTLLIKDHGEEIKEGGPGSGPQPGDREGARYKTGHKKGYMKPGAGPRPGSAKDGGQTDDEADQYDTEIGEADLTKSQVKKVHKMADKLPKKDFMKRYGKDGDSVRYATATNMLKKKMGIGENKFKLNKGELQMSESYKQRFDSAMEHLGVSSLGELNPEDQKPFFTFVDDLKEGLTAAQKKLPPALQKAIMKKMKDKKEAKGHKGDIKGALKTEDLVGGQKKLDKDKDGDLDAKDFAMLRKGAKKEMMMKDKMKREDQRDDDEDNYSAAINFVLLKHGYQKKIGNRITYTKPGIKSLDDVRQMLKKQPGGKAKLDQINREVESKYKQFQKEDALGQEPMKKMKAPMPKEPDTTTMKDAPKAKEGMKAVVKTKQVTENRRYLQTKPGSLEEAVLKTRGLVK